MTPTSGITTRRRVQAGLGALMIAATLTACGGGADSGSSDVAAPDAASGGYDVGADERKPAGKANDTALTAETDAADTTTAARVLPDGRDVVYRGSITVRVRDVALAAARAEGLATGAGGIVFAEQTSIDPRDRRRGQATLTLRVPPTVFGETLDKLGGLGKELDRTRSAEDVTTQVADVDSRLRSQQRSVERVRALLDRAVTIGEVVRVEAELAARESNLESLQAQLAKLTDITDLATIQVTLVSPDREATVAVQDADLGFQSGLRGGWDAFVGIVLVVLTVLGALVPFAVAAAVLGVPALLLWRSRRRPEADPASAG